MGKAELSTQYVIDADDIITGVSDSWDGFASENNAPSLSHQNVVGAPLWDFFSNDAVRYLYGQVLSRVRDRKAPVRLAFRCDSPTIRRFMHVLITPGPDGGVRFDSMLEREEERAPIRLLDPVVDRAPDLVALCSWCKRVRVSEDAWVEVEEAIDRMDLFGGECPPGITHSICSACEDRVHAAIAAVE